MKYALIGCGRISPNHIEAAKNNRLDFVAMCDIIPDTMREKAKNYSFSGFEIVSYEDYLKHNYSYNKMVFIDELELFVKSLGNNLNGYSLSLGDD